MKALLAAPALVLATSLGFLVASCGADGDATSAGPIPPVSTTDATAQEIPSTTSGTTNLETTATETAPPPSRVTYQVWFANPDGLFVTYRSETATPRVGTAALESLLAGPDSFEQGYGLGSEVPEDTQLLGLAIERGIARVDLTSEFESGGGSASMQTRLAQVVYTITQFPTVKGVLFSLDGEPVDVIGGEGILVDEPLTRRDFARLLPAILVTGPALGQEVGSPVTIRGSANVFEANVGIQILDEHGDVLVETFTTATCGTGCRGVFATQVVLPGRSRTGRARSSSTTTTRPGRAPSRTRCGSPCRSLRERKGSESVLMNDMAIVSSYAFSEIDDSVIDRARDGDQEAFAAVVRHYDPGLRAFAFHLLGDRDRMDAALQEAYVRAFRAVPRFRGRQRAGTWLYEIVYGACMEELEAGEEANVTAASAAGLAGALRELAAEERAAVLLVDAQGFGRREAGRVLGIPQELLLRRLADARSALRRSLENAE